MDTYTKDELFDFYDQLPQDLRDAMFSVDTAKIIREVGLSNSLNVAQMGMLAEETGFVFLGASPVNKFIDRLIERLGIDKEKAKKIAHEINEKVFSKVRETLKEIHGLKPKTEKSMPPKPEEEKPAISSMIEPQKPILDKEVELMDDLSIARDADTKTAPLTGFLKETPETTDEETTKPMAEKPQDPATPAETPAVKDIFAERTKEEGSIAGSETVVNKETWPPKAENPKYNKGTDPYREPIE